MNNHIEALSYYLGAFVDELTRLNVCDVVISPGSRSTPIALLMEQHEGMNTYLHVDERSAGFFALGIAKAKKTSCCIIMYVRNGLRRTTIQLYVKLFIRECRLSS